MRPRGGPKLPNVNVYLVPTAEDMPQVLSQWVLYNITYDPGDGAGLYYSPDGLTLVRLAEGAGGLPSVAQGDVLYGSAPDVLATLPKDTNSTRALINQGPNNNPVWGLIHLDDGVTDDLGVAHLDGGTGASGSTFWRGDASWAAPPYPPSFSGAGADGLVPDPGSETGKFLKDDGSWAAPSAPPSAAFGGKVAAAGTAISLPAGWSSALSVITYTITHNLGFADGDAYSVVCTARNVAAHVNVQVNTQGANDFTVRCFNDENSNITTSDFNFVLVPI